MSRNLAPCHMVALYISADMTATAAAVRMAARSLLRYHLECHAVYPFVSLSRGSNVHQRRYDSYRGGSQDGGSAMPSKQRRLLDLFHLFPRAALLPSLFPFKPLEFLLIMKIKTFYFKFIGNSIILFAEISLLSSVA